MMKIVFATILTKETAKNIADITIAKTAIFFIFLLPLLKICSLSALHLGLGGDAPATHSAYSN
jgi:hypothetical protein